MTMPLGAILKHRNHIADGELAAALASQQQSGARLGEILIADGKIDYLSLYKALAEQLEIPFVNLLTDPPDAAFFEGLHPEECLSLNVIPWRMQDGHVHVAIANHSPDALAWIRKRYGDGARLVFTAPYDIRVSIERHFGKQLEQESTLALWVAKPLASARRTLVSGQKYTLFIGMVGGLIGVAFHPQFMAFCFAALCLAAYSANMIFKCAVFFAGRKTQGINPPLLTDRELPVYTVLIPMYREAASLPRMLAAMNEMDYPKAKLDIKLILEESDEETLQAAYHLKPNRMVEIVCVPHGALKTKPKACNYALKFARGELVTVFDADDRPDPLQLRKAASAFALLPADVACLQARLHYYNADYNWLTRFFELEYRMLFDVTLQGLERLALPIPLGGTSNHMRLHQLKAVGEWDPFNVTEDADLGVRLSALGLRTMMLDSDTREEATCDARAWIMQRSRWIKGYMQTWLVHMRSPRALYASLGPAGFLGFQFALGLSCFVFLSAPVMWIFAALWYAEAIDFPGWMAGWAAANLLIYLISHWGMAWYVLLHRPVTRGVNMWPAGAFYPLYLIMPCFASYRALYQLIKNPHFWDKTTHGADPQKIALNPLTKALHVG